MKKTAILFIIGFSLIALTAIAQKKANKEKVAEVSFLIGTAKEKPANRRLKINDTIFAGTTIQTGKECVCELSLLDQSRIRIGENSEYTVNPIQKKESSSIFGFLGLGKVWVKLKKMVSRNSYAIKSPNSVISVRGTTFSMEVTSDQKGKVNVFEGRVDAGTHWILENDSLFDAWVRDDEKAYREYLEANDPEIWVQKLEDEYKEAIEKMLQEEEAFYNQDALDYENFLREEQGLPPIEPQKHGPLAETGKGGWLSFVKEKQTLMIDGKDHSLVPIGKDDQESTWTRFNAKRDSVLGW